MFQYFIILILILSLEFKNNQTKTLKNYKIMKQKNLLLLIWTLLWNLWNIQIRIRIAEFRSQKWTLGPYKFAISHVFGFGFYLSDRVYGTGPGGPKIVVWSCQVRIFFSFMSVTLTLSWQSYHRQDSFEFTPVRIRIKCS